MVTTRRRKKLSTYNCELSTAADRCKNQEFTHTVTDHTKYVSTTYVPWKLLRRDLLRDYPGFDNFVIFRFAASVPDVSFDTSSTFSLKESLSSPH